MNVMVKHIIEIAGGLVIGSLVNDGLDKLVEVSKKVVKESKKNGAQ